MFSKSASKDKTTTQAQQSTHNFLFERDILRAVRRLDCHWLFPTMDCFERSHDLLHLRKRWQQHILPQKKAFPHEKAAYSSSSASLIVMSTGSLDDTPAKFCHCRAILTPLYIFHRN